MKRFISIIVCIAALVCFSTPFSADSVYRYGDWTLSAISGSGDFSFGIRSYNADDAVVTVPNDYGGYPIVKIEEYAFATNTNVREVILNDHLTTIGAGAFAQCKNLTKIAIPDSVTQIGDNAFQGCDQVVVYGTADSDAIAYAKEQNISFICVNKVTYVLGDADEDGVVTVLDATAIQRTLAALSTIAFSERAADIDQNQLNILDATWIQRFLADIETPYEIGKVITIYE